MVKTDKNLVKNNYLKNILNFLKKTLYFFSLIKYNENTIKNLEGVYL